MSTTSSGIPRVKLQRVHKAKPLVATAKPLVATAKRPDPRKKKSDPNDPNDPLNSWMNK